MRHLASLVLLLLLPGCVPGALTVDLGPRTPASPAPTPTVAPSATPTPLASPTPAPSPSVIPGSPPWIGPIHTNALSGMVYDEEGNPVEDATLRVNSLDTQVPFTASTTTTQGKWMFKAIPDGINLEIVASKAGWTTRRRVGSFQTEPVDGYVVNFGGSRILSNGGVDPGDTSYLSQYPEVSATEPAYVPIDGTTLKYTLRLSDPLDDANRRRLEAALRIGPASPTALNASEAPRDFAPDATLPTPIRQGTRFYGDPGTLVTTAWNPAGDELTVAFHAPLPASQAGPTPYQVYLVAGAEPIADQDHHALGQDAFHQRTAFTAGQLIRHAFYREGYYTLPSGEPDRWSATHTDAAAFTVKPDTQPPKLIGAHWLHDGPDGRLDLTFDEPMCAFAGPTFGIAPGIEGADRLKGMDLAFSTNAGAFQPVRDLDLTAAQLADPTFHFTTAEQAFRFDSAAYTLGSHAQAMPGQITVEPDPRAPQTVHLYVVGRADLFSGAPPHLLVRLDTFADVAGNLTTQVAVVADVEP